MTFLEVTEEKLVVFSNVAVLQPAILLKYELFYMYFSNNLRAFRDYLLQGTPFNDRF